MLYQESRKGMRRAEGTDERRRYMLFRKGRRQA